MNIRIGIFTFSLNANVCVKAWLWSSGKGGNNLALGYHLPVDTKKICQYVESHLDYGCTIDCIEIIGDLKAIHGPFCPTF